MMRATALPKNSLLGLFLFFVAVAFAVAPLPVLWRDLAITLIAYLAFILSGIAFSYLVVIIAPPLGLLSGDAQWLVMQPIMISSGLLAMLGLEYGWRYPALVVSPLLYLMPLIFAWRASQTELLAVALPFEPTPLLWLVLHALVALAGVLIALYLDRLRERRT